MHQGLKYIRLSMRQIQSSRGTLVTIIAGFLLLLLYVAIFGFSGQDGDTSGNLSFHISELCVDFFKTVSGKNWSEVFMAELVEYFENPIRKLAHFGEYAVMGILVHIILIQWRKRDRYFYFILFLWVLISASVDEIHQYFVPGRYNSLIDVIIDTCGGMFGAFFCSVIYKFKKAK